MVRRIDDGLRKGAVAVGLGPSYTAAATQWEILEVFRAAARHHAPVHVHIRGGIAGLEEVIAGSAITGTPLHVVHINSSGLAQTREMLQIITEARSRGLDVTTEAYPYTAGMTEIQSANYDAWESWPNERFATLEWPVTGERLTRETFVKYRKIGGPVIGHSNTDEMVAVAINSPITAIASDGYMSNGIGHPRTSGTYSRVLGHYVRESWFAVADGRVAKDDAHAGTAPRGSRPGHAEQGPRARRGRCRPDAFRSRTRGGPRHVPPADPPARRDPARPRQRRPRR